jgi:hypothetical protein
VAVRIAVFIAVGCGAVGIRLEIANCCFSGSEQCTF